MRSLITANEAAEILGVHPNAVYKILKRNKIDGLKSIGATTFPSTRFNRKAVELLAEGRTRYPKRRGRPPSGITPKRLKYPVDNGPGPSSRVPERAILEYRAGIPVRTLAKKYGVSRQWMYEFIAARIAIERNA